MSAFDLICLQDVIGMISCPACTYSNEESDEELMTDAGPSDESPSVEDVIVDSVGQEQMEEEEEKCKRDVTRTFVGVPKGIWSLRTH